VRDLLHSETPAFVDAVRHLRAWDLDDNSDHRVLSGTESNWIHLLQAKVHFDCNQHPDLSEFVEIAEISVPD
jgi:hypothetical protein